MASETDLLPGAVHRDPFSPDTFIHYNGTWFPQSLQPSPELFKDIKELKLHKDDVFVTGFPKSGTSWVQEIVWRVSHPDATAEEQSKWGNIDQRFDFLEMVTHPQLKQSPGYKERSQLISSRFFKTHYPFRFLPEDISAGTGKVIYIARDVKDVCVSLFYFIRTYAHLGFTGNFEDFFASFVKGTVTYGPWLTHVKDAWLHRDDPNVLFLTYEQLLQSPAEEVRRVAEFLGRSLSDTQLDNIVQATSFAAMKQDPNSNHDWLKEWGHATKDMQFMRKGVVGDWRNHMTSEMSDVMESQCLQPLRDLGLSFTQDGDPGVSLQ